MYMKKYYGKIKMDENIIFADEIPIKKDLFNSKILVLQDIDSNRLGHRKEVGKGMFNDARIGNHNFHFISILSNAKDRFLNCPNPKFVHLFICLLACLLARVTLL